MSFTIYRSWREQKQMWGEGERVASFKSDVNGSTNPLKMITERWGKKGKTIKQNNRQHIYFRNSATIAQNELVEIPLEEIEIVYSKNVSSQCL